MRTKNLPETESLQDDEKILCSPDDEHLYKIKKRFITGAGSSKGGLMYWTETKDKIYSQLKGEQEETDDELTEHVNYISRTSMQITPDGTCFSAGEMDNEDNYTERFRVDAVNGDIYENGQKLSRKYLQMADVHGPSLIFSDTPTKIGTWPDGRDVNRVAYHFNGSSTVSSYTLASSQSYTPEYGPSDVVCVDTFAAVITSPTNMEYEYFPLPGDYYRNSNTSMGFGYDVSIVTNNDNCNVVFDLVPPPDKPTSVLQYYGLVIVVDYVI